MANITTPIGFNFTAIPESFAPVPPDIVGPAPNTWWGGSPDGTDGFFDPVRGYGWVDNVTGTGYPRTGWRGGNVGRIHGDAHTNSAVGPTTFRMLVAPGVYRIGTAFNGNLRVLDDTTQRLYLTPTITDTDTQFADAAGRGLTEAEWGADNAEGYAATPSTVEVVCSSGILNVEISAGIYHFRLIQVSSFNPPTITSDPAGVEVSRPATATFSVTLGGGSYTALRWQTRPTSSGTITDISGANTTSYTTGATDLPMSGSQYRLAADWEGGTAYSAWATLTVNAGPAGEVSDVTGTAAGGTTATVSFTAGTPAATSHTLELESPLGAGNWAAPASTLIGSTFSVSGLVAVTQYRPRVRATNAAGSSAWALGADFTTDNVGTGGGSLLEGDAPEPPTFTVHPLPVVCRVGTNATFSVEVAGAPATSITWQRNVGGVWVDINGVWGDTYTFVATLADAGALFRSVVTNGVGGAVSASVPLVVTIGPKRRWRGMAWMMAAES